MHPEAGGRHSLPSLSKTIGISGSVCLWELGRAAWWHLRGGFLLTEQLFFLMQLELLWCGEDRCVCAFLVGAWLVYGGKEEPTAGSRSSELQKQCSGAMLLWTSRQA